MLILVPIGLSLFWRKRGLALTKRRLIIAGIFGIAFGFVEASVVVYLRAALGVLPGYPAIQVVNALPKSLLDIELYREAATIVMLASVALLAAKQVRERWAIFFWMFATWDLFFYIGTWLMIRWPDSWTTPDVLFLIPVPWLAQVWFPILVSLLTLIAVVIGQ